MQHKTATEAQFLLNDPEPAYMDAYKSAAEKYPTAHAGEVDAAVLPEGVYAQTNLVTGDVTFNERYTDMPDYVAEHERRHVVQGELIQEYGLSAKEVAAAKPFLEGQAANMPDDPSYEQFTQAYQNLSELLQDEETGTAEAAAYVKEFLREEFSTTDDLFAGVIERSDGLILVDPDPAYGDYSPRDDLLVDDTAHTTAAVLPELEQLDLEKIVQMLEDAAKRFAEREAAFAEELREEYLEPLDTD